MAITRNDIDEEFRGGVVVRSTPVQRDVTQPATRADIVAKARQALTNNATFLAAANPTNAQNAAQVKALTRQVNGLIRVLGTVLPEMFDLLAENTDT